MTDGPVIADATLAAGHDGRAELVVDLAYPNGGHTRLSVSQEALGRVLAGAGVARLEDLRGQPWTMLIGDTVAPNELTNAPTNASRRGHDA
jgi:hypothetical protein